MNGDIRLRDGATITEGQVEVCNNLLWGTICDDAWQEADAAVACRQLGFSPSGSTCLIGQLEGHKSLRALVEDSK